MSDIVVPIAYALNRLVPSAQYRGSLTADTQAAYEALVWLDGRPQPSWAAVLASAQEPATPPTPVPPASCTKLGLKRAFSEMDLWEQVKGFIASDPDRQEEWDLATELKLSDPIMVTAIQAFAISGITIDPVRLATRANELVA